MAQSKVYLIKNNLLSNFRDFLKEQLPSYFVRNEKICLKLHMGEYGNLNYVRPPIVEAIVNELKRLKARPFLYDSPVAYRSPRDTVRGYQEVARRNGFAKETIGCPVIISNKGIAVEGQHFSRIAVCQSIWQADGLIVISHFKGHELTNFGGAIKNLGMGAVTQETKATIHNETGIKIDNIEKCVGCGACVKICPEQALSLKDKKVNVDYTRCFGCCACVAACKQKVLLVKNISLSKGLAEVAKIVVQKFKLKKVFYVNVLLDITAKCDCYPIGDSPADIQYICPNLGILCSDDAMAIDKASFELVNQYSGGQFGKIWPADPNEQVDYGVEINLGSKIYDLIVID